MKKLFQILKIQAALGIACIALVGLAPNTSKISEVCFATLEVDCTRCTSSECPVPDHGGVDLGIGVEPDALGAPSGCGAILIETEKPFLVYNYMNIYGAEHY